MEGYIGEIRLFAGSFAPSDWAYCDGASLPTASYSALYSIVGNIYGGNTSNFNLPNLGARVAVGRGTGFNLGQTGGNQNVTLATGNLPVHSHPVLAHSHTLYGSGAAATGTSPSGALSAVTDENAYGTANAAAMNSAAVGESSAGNTGTTGSGTAFSVMPPYLAVNYIICVTGWYPSRP